MRAGSLFFQHLEDVNGPEGKRIAKWFHDTVETAVKQSFNMVPASPTVDEIDRRIDMAVGIIEREARAGKSSKDTAKKVLAPLCGELLTGQIQDRSFTSGASIVEGSESVEYVDRK